MSLWKVNAISESTPGSGVTVTGLISANPTVTLPTGGDADLTTATLGWIFASGVSKAIGLARLGGFIARQFGIYIVTDPKFGATGDGTTDDTAAIQAAITAASPTSGIVFFPPGNYKTTAALTVTAGQVKFVANGAQGTATIIKSHTGDAVTVSYGQVEFHHVAIDAAVGTSTTYGTSGRGIYVANAVSTTPNFKFLGGSINNIDVGIEFATASGSGAIVAHCRIAPYTTTYGSEGKSIYINATDYLGSACPRHFTDIETGGGIIAVNGGNDTFIKGCFTRRIVPDSNAFHTNISGCRFGNLGNAMTIDGQTTLVVGCAFSGPVTLASTMTGAYVGNGQSGNYAFTDSTIGGNCTVLHHVPNTTQLKVGPHSLYMVPAAGLLQAATQSTDKGDTAALSYTPGVSEQFTLYDTTITATRSLTIVTTNAFNGEMVGLVRGPNNAAGFNLNLVWNATVLKSLTAASTMAVARIFTDKNGVKFAVLQS